MTQLVESSDSELNIDIGSDEEETEEQIIERRRQEREQLLKVSIIVQFAVKSTLIYWKSTFCLKKESGG